MKEIVLGLLILLGFFDSALFAEERLIATSKQDASPVTVYDEKGIFIFSKSGELVGYTPTTDNKGNFKFSK